MVQGGYQPLLDSDTAGICTRNGMLARPALASQVMADSGNFGQT